MLKINCITKKKKQKKSYYVILSKNNTPSKQITLFDLGVFNPRLKLYIFNFKKLNVYNKLGYISSKSFLGYYYYYLKTLLK